MYNRKEERKCFFRIVASVWYWVCGLRREVFIIIFHLRACVFWWRRERRIQDLQGVCKVRSGILVDTVECYMGQIGVLLSIRTGGLFRRISKNTSHMPRFVDQVSFVFVFFFCLISLIWFDLVQNDFVWFLIRLVWFSSIYKSRMENNRYWQNDAWCN